MRQGVSAAPWLAVMVLSRTDPPPVLRVLERTRRMPESAHPFDTPAMWMQAGLAHVFAAQIAVLDSQGTVVAVNAAWECFGRPRQAPPPSGWASASTISGVPAGRRRESRGTGCPHRSPGRFAGSTSILYDGILLPRAWQAMLVPAPEPPCCPRRTAAWSWRTSTSPPASWLKNSCTQPCGKDILVREVSHRVGEEQPAGHLEPAEPAGGRHRRPAAREPLPGEPGASTPWRWSTTCPTG